MIKQKWSRKMYILLIVLLFVQPILICSYLYYKKNKGFEKYNYLESDDIKKNPYCGAYMQSGTNKDARKNLRTEFAKNKEISMVLFAYNLDDEWEMEEIPKEKLEDLEKSLSLAEEMGISVILRAAHDFRGEPRDPEFSIIVSHMKQIAEVVNRHKDCIAGVQAGMLGVYGEWHSSKYMEDVHYRLEVIRTWLDCLDEDVYISVRRPAFIREAMEHGIDSNRIGFYNDGFFASDSDLGTYVGDYNREADLEWVHENIKIPFNGGEMPYVTEYSSIKNVVEEAELLNLTYLNYWYSTEVWESWKKENYGGLTGDAYLRKHLGCRLYVDEMKVQKNFEERDHFEVEISLNNNGFSVIDPNMKAYLIMEYNGEKVEKELSLDMSSKNAGKVYGIIENPFAEKIQEAKEKHVENGIALGLKIARNQETSEAYCVEFANDSMLFQDGYNWLLSPY